MQSTEFKLVVSRAIKWQIQFLRFFGIQFESYLDLYFGKFFYSMSRIGKNRKKIKLS